MLDPETFTPALYIVHSYPSCASLLNDAPYLDSSPKEITKYKLLVGYQRRPGMKTNSCIWEEYRVQLAFEDSLKQM